MTHPVTQFLSCVGKPAVASLAVDARRAELGAEPADKGSGFGGFQDTVVSWGCGCGHGCGCLFCKAATPRAAQGNKDKPALHTVAVHSCQLLLTAQGAGGPRTSAQTTRPQQINGLHVTE